MRTKKTFKRVAYMLTMTVLAISLTLSSQAALRGYAAYRDKAFIGGQYSGHAGIVDMVTTDGRPVFYTHHPGTGTLTWVNATTFQAPGQCTYYGEFYKPGYGASKYADIADLAYDLYYDYSIYYVATCQMTLTTPATSIPTAKIEPQYVYEMRCDGLVEYCYEYYGIELLSTTAGGVSYWNISNKAHYDIHIESPTHRPMTQKDKLTLS
ncbi:MAG TPA: hypothetical protein VN369_07915 [Terriglobales bacterium]|nr:hypothetical protein [Terriglobales bacterium]